MARYGRGGIGRALGFAKLGMRIEGEAGDRGPAPGSREFGERAKKRRRRINRKDYYFQEDRSLQDTVLKA